MPSTEASAYPWPSEIVFAAELDLLGTIVRANDALHEATGELLEGLPFRDLLAGEQRGSFDERVEAASDHWQRRTFGFLDGGGGPAEDRVVWMRRTPAGCIETIAEPAWRERDRLVDQVLQLNDDLIATQRDLGRRQRDLEYAQGQVARSARRVHQLEAIVLAGLTPRDFDEALRSLLRTARRLLPGDRADILLLDEAGDRLFVRASAGLGAPLAPDGEPIALGEGEVGGIAASGQSTLVERLALAGSPTEPPTQGSLIGTPLRVEGEVIGVLVVTASSEACFSEADLRLLELVGERVALAVGQAQLRDREQRLAETLQRTLLPQSLPDLPNLEIVARYLPRATSVGGDFYDAVLLPDNRVGVAIGDVTGKGLRAAAAMGRLRSALHAYALDTPAPVDVLERLNRLALADQAMATALYLVLDPATGWVEMAVAGHPPPLRLDDGVPSYIDVRAALSPPLGLPVSRRGQLVFELPPRSALLLYTDGLVELTRDIDEGLALLQAAATQAPAELDGLCDHVLAGLAPAGRYRDDVAMLALRRREGSRRAEPRGA